MDARIAVVGGRTFNNKKYMFFYLDRYREKYGISWIVSGGAKGADTLAEEYARSRQILGFSVFLAQWDDHGSSAGYIRNDYIVKAADLVFAFPTKESKGTWGTVELAKKAGKEVFIFELDKEEDA